MMKCIACGSDDVQRARNDCGHFKAEGIKPIRMYQYRCKSCGFVSTYAKDGENS